MSPVRFIAASCLVGWMFPLMMAAEPAGGTAEWLKMAESGDPMRVMAGERALVKAGHEETIQRLIADILSRNPDRQGGNLEIPATRALPYLFKALPNASPAPSPQSWRMSSRSPALRLALIITETLQADDAFPQTTLAWAEKAEARIRSTREALGQEEMAPPALEELGWWWEHNRQAVMAGRPQDAGWVPTMENSPRILGWLEQAASGDEGRRLAAEKLLVKAGHEPTITRLVAGLAATSPQESVLESRESMSLRTLAVLFRHLREAPLVPAPAASDDSHPRAEPPKIRLAHLILSTIVMDHRIPDHTRTWAMKMAEKLDPLPDPEAGVLEVCRQLDDWWARNQEMVTEDRPKDAVWLPEEEEKQRIRELLAVVGSEEDYPKQLAEETLIHAGHEPTIQRVAGELVRGENSRTTLENFSFHIKSLEPLHDALPKASMAPPPVLGDLMISPASTRIAKVFLDTIHHETRFPAVTRRWARRTCEEVLSVDPYHPKDSDAEVFRKLDEWWTHNGAAVKAGRPREAVWLPER